MTAGQLPRWLWAIALVGLLLLTVPLLGLGSRVPWADLPTLLRTPEALDALGLSLRTCLASTAVAVGFGVPIALLLARGRGRWVAVVRVVTVLPMVLPPVVAGLALLATLGRRGPIGGPLAALGIEVGFTTAAVVIAQAFVAMPYVVIALEGALRTFDTGFERVAASLGASPATVLRRVTLPLLAPALWAGTAMAAARALGEFGATLTFAGSLAGTTRTLTLEIYLQRETSPGVALALSLVLIVLAAILVGVTGLTTSAARSRPADG